MHEDQLVRTNDIDDITMRPNTCWQVDQYQISGCGAEGVHVLAITDAYDRSIITLLTAQTHFSDSRIKELILECIEQRKNIRRAKRPIVCGDIRNCDRRGGDPNSV